MDVARPPWSDQQVSGRLNSLREAGLVVAEPYGRLAYHRLLPPMIERGAGPAAKARAGTHHSRERP